MYDINPLFLTDGYKLGHIDQYPSNTSMVYSNWTPRGSRILGINKVVVLGEQYLAKRYLIDSFNTNFFRKPKMEAVAVYKLYVDKYLGTDISVRHIEALHDLGYLPILMKSLPEGVSAPLRVPHFTISNTLPEFFWLTNYLETLMSNVLWQFSTSATIAKRFRDTLLHHIMETDKDNVWFVDWQGHDFSMRGMSGIDSAMYSGVGHAASFNGSDSFPVMAFLAKYYNAGIIDDLIIGSVAATEHSVMSAGSQEGEIETFERLMDIYPKGILSVVSDTWDLWKVLTEYLPRMKDRIMDRDGKLVIRPDSGDPVKIITGDDDAPVGSNEYKGVVQLLWDVFGGTVNDQDFRVLDSHIGAIYGDSITVDRATRIMERLAMKGFAATNVVLGIGSFTYQYNTRDTFGFAMKATYAEYQNEDGSTSSQNLFKDPITDDGLKKSAKGLLQVIKNDEGEYELRDEVNWDEEMGGELRTIFCDGELMVDDTWIDIRERIANS